MSRMILWMALVVLLVPAVSMAQNVKNPSAVAFESTDHAKVTGYEVDIVSSTGVVLQTQQGGKGTQDAAGVVTVAFSVQNVAFGTAYTVRVRAIVAGTPVLKSVDSDPSPAWDRVPAQPVKVTIR